jgi:hypothetical protein
MSTGAPGFASRTVLCRQAALIGAKPVVVGHDALASVVLAFLLRMIDLHGDLLVANGRPSAACAQA